MRTRFRLAALFTALALAPVVATTATTTAPAAADGSASGTATTGTGSTATTGTTAGSLPAVDMAATVKAAQIDPRRADSTRTPGAEASVLLVEKALQARGLLAARWVDGYFGTTTVTAYTRFQTSLGYTGLDANGLPGRTSLTALGTNRFRVTNVLTPGARIDEGGGIVVNARTRAMLDEAERLLGRTLVLSQGSYNVGGDPTSAGTHDGGGVVDISVAGIGTAARTTIVRTLRQVGFAAWLRTPSQGDWPFHIHAAAISDTDLSSQAQHQTGDYYLGRNGLANRGADDGPRVTIRTWEEYQRL